MSLRSKKNRQIDQEIFTAVDVVIFTVRKNSLQALLIQMKYGPFAGKWAFPGGIIGTDELTADAARRVLESSTGMRQAHLEQLYTFDDPKRDPRARVISVAYFALVPDADVELKTTAKYSDVRWLTVGKLPALAYDHARIAEVALERLRAKLEYTNIVWSLLPPKFTLTELQQVYETVLGKKIDKRNFRKGLLATGLLAATGEMEAGGRHRPAELYRFRQRRTVIGGLT